ncbi:MAG TPA: LCP family protein, partial [Egibacteraceae bacterium]|nr:LCP family protein [Egibacteraceae bacterium]
APARQDTLLLVRHSQDPGGATGVTLLAASPGDARSLVLFVPIGTLVEVPGFGLDRLGLAYQYGGPALVEASLENALGIAIDHTAAVSDSGLAALLGRVGGLELAVPERLVLRAGDGAAMVRFEPGGQFLDGPRLAEYWGFVQRGEDELASFSRQQLVWERLLAAAAADPTVVERLLAGGAPQLETDAETVWLQSLLAGLAQAQASDRLSFTLLPVQPFGAAGSVATADAASFRLDEQAAAELVGSLLLASVPDGDASAAVRVQVLNGVGVPGIGQLVDERLEGGGFRIVLTDNASRFDFAQTRIVVYDESPASIDAAQRVHERLGVGTILVSRQPQTVVDLTIVVGADFAAQPNREQPS